MQLLDVASLEHEDFEKILSFLRKGGVIAFPTDTAYGLGADPFNESAVREIFEIKRRPETKPILLLVNSIPMAETVAKLPPQALTLAARFWPGPLTMILPAAATVPDLLTAGTGSIGVRLPQSPFAQRLLAALGHPITATSANLTGNPAAVTVGELVDQLGSRLKIVIDGGTLPVAGGSTIVDLTGRTPVVLRPGPVAYADLSETLRGNIR
jgi:L-threonylcarbamoyladenylate synthase